MAFLLSRLRAAGRSKVREELAEVAAKLLYSVVVEAVARRGPLYLAAHEARLPEHLEMLRNSALGQRQHFDHLSANADAALREYAQDLEPRRMAQRFEAAGE
jgi:hypothetical protein